jgi:hypothetical protein
MRRVAWLRGPVVAEVGGKIRLSGGQRVAVGVSVALGMGLAAYGVAGSYQTVSGLAVRRGVPLAQLVPVGIDGGLIGVVVLDLVLSWIGQPIGWLRQFARVLTVGTVAANAAAGWPDLVSAGLHVAAPLMLLAMVEAARTVLLRRIGAPDGRPREAIPVARWVLAPWPTWLMWRRMVLWQITSVRAAVEAEQERQHAVALLRVRYGRRWRRHAPPELVWMLRSGVSTRDVVARALVLAAAADSDIEHAAAGGTPAADMSARARSAANGHVGGRTGPGRTRMKPAMNGVSGSAVRVSAAMRADPDRGDPLAKAASLLADRPDMSGADLGRELGVSPRHGLRLKERVNSRSMATAAN